MTTPKTTPLEQTGQLPTNREYVCAICRTEFVSEWTDEEAKDELKEKFGETNIQACEVVCDACYDKLMVYEQACRIQEEEGGDVNHIIKERFRSR